MSERVWKVGVAGLRRGCSYGRLFSLDPQCVVAACCDPAPEALQRFQEVTGVADAVCHTDYERFIETEMDAVVIASPILFHAEQTIRALERGCHVLCEVTMAMTVEECRRVVETVRRTGKIYMLAENCIYWPFLKEWKTMVRAGRLGGIFYAECEYLHPLANLIVNPETGARLWRADRPPLIYCTHSLGPILEIMDDRITRAMAIGQGHRLLPGVGVGGTDIQVALFQTEKDSIIKLLRSNVAPHGGFHHHYRFQGTRGHVETLPHDKERKGWLYIEDETDSGREIACPIVDTTLPPEAQKGGHGTAEYELLRAFFRAIETGEKPWLDEVRAWELSVPGIIAQQSVEQGGCWLDVPPVG